MIDQLVKNDNPKLPNGESAMFTRFLDKAGVRQCVNQLRELNPDAPADMDDGGFLRIYAPDGDLVFSALPKSKTAFICRLNKEVFQQ